MGTSSGGAPAWVGWLLACFGLSSWIFVNSIFVELPLLANELPEGWTAEFDESNNRQYYYNAKTDESSWTRPTADKV